MCDIIERIEFFGIDLEQLQAAVEKRPGPKVGTLSPASITLIILGVVEEEWKRRSAADER